MVSTRLSIGPEATHQYSLKLERGQTRAASPAQNPRRYGRLDEIKVSPSFRVPRHSHAPWRSVAVICSVPSTSGRISGASEKGECIVCAAD